MSEPRAYDVKLEDGGVLRVIIRREFDTGSLHQDWAHTIIQSNPGPCSQVVVDLSNTGLLSSTFFAGLIKLHMHYNRAGTSPLRLLSPDPRTWRNLTMLRMDKLFQVEQRT